MFFFELIFRLGLMSTIFTHVDGRQMYASNPVLSQKEIYNVLRSGGQTEVIDMRISVKTTTQQLERLAQQLNTEIKTKFMKDFFPDLECYVTKVDWEQETMSVELWLNHRLNFQNGRARWIRSTNFAKILRQAVAEVGLEGGKMEVINLVGVSDWFAAIENQGTVSRQTPRPSRMLPEGFVDNSPAITVENVDENDDDFFQGDGDTGIEGERL